MRRWTPEHSQDDYYLNARPGTFENAKLPHPADLDDTKRYCLLQSGEVVEYRECTVFKHEGRNYLGSGHIYCSFGMYVMAAAPSNRDFLHFYR